MLNVHVLIFMIIAGVAAHSFLQLSLGWSVVVAFLTCAVLFTLCRSKYLRNVVFLIFGMLDSVIVAYILFDIINLTLYKESSKSIYDSYPAMIVIYAALVVIFTVLNKRSSDQHYSWNYKAKVSDQEWHEYEKNRDRQERETAKKKRAEEREIKAEVKAMAKGEIKLEEPKQQKEDNNSTPPSNWDML